MSEAKKTYLSKIQLKAELDRCLNCKNQPCMHACPVNCNPQEFINHAKQGAYGEAVKTITRTNPMGQTCGLICPDKFCMQACTRSRIDFAVNIPKVQATILENFRNDGEDYSQTKPKGKNVAVIDQVRRLVSCRLLSLVVSRIVKLAPSAQISTQVVRTYGVARSTC